MLFILIERFSRDSNLIPISEPMVVSYNGQVSDYPTISCHMMTATTESVLDSVLVNSLVKNEPEDLTGQRHRHGSDISLDVGVTAKRLLGDSLDKQSMGLVTSPDGDSHIILNSKFAFAFGVFKDDTVKVNFLQPSHSIL